MRWSTSWAPISESSARHPRLPRTPSRCWSAPSLELHQRARAHDADDRARSEVDGGTRAQRVAAASIARARSPWSAHRRPRRERRSTPMYLCRWMRQSGLPISCRRCATRSTSGLRAGSMVMTPRIGHDFVRWTPATGGDERIGTGRLLDHRHLDRRRDARRVDGRAERWAAGLSVPAYAIDDQTAIRVTGDAPSTSSPRGTGGSLPTDMTPVSRDFPLLLAAALRRRPGRRCDHRPRRVARAEPDHRRGPAGRCDRLESHPGLASCWPWSGSIHLQRPLLARIVLVVGIGAGIVGTISNTHLTPFHG